MTTTETPMQRIERAERDALRLYPGRTPPTDVTGSKQNVDAIAADQRGRA